MLTSWKSWLGREDRTSAWRDQIRCLTAWLRPIAGPAVRRAGGTHHSPEGARAMAPAAARSAAAAPLWRLRQLARAGAGPRCIAASVAATVQVCGGLGSTSRERVGRSVAQPGSALASGARGREFRSPRSDQFFQLLVNRTTRLGQKTAQRARRLAAAPAHLRAAMRRLEAVTLSRDSFLDLSVGGNIAIESV